MVHTSIVHLVCARSSCSTASEVASAAIHQYDANTNFEDGTHFEAFEYQDVADFADNVKNAFDELTGVSPLWFSVENDEGAGTRGRSFGGKRDGGGGCERFGDWVVGESLVDVFEDEPPAGSDGQVCAKNNSVYFFLVEVDLRNKPRQRGHKGPIVNV